MSTVKVNYIDTSKYKVTVDFDDVWWDFSDYTDAYKIVQFRDTDFNSYENLGDYCTENGKLLPSIQAKLRSGKMFTIDYSRYSSTDGGFYGLDGGIPTGEVDTQDVNGFIIFEDYCIKNISYEDRKKYAKQDLQTYTEWANGETYSVLIEDGMGNTVESCGGFVGIDKVQKFIADTIPNCINENVDIQGQYNDGSSYEVYFDYNDCLRTNKEN